MTGLSKGSEHLSITGSLFPPNSVKLRRWGADASAMPGPPYSEISKSQISSAPLPEKLLGPGPGRAQMKDSLSGRDTGGEPGADGAAQQNGAGAVRVTDCNGGLHLTLFGCLTLFHLLLSTA